jgi:hypothetical protein
MRVGTPDREGSTAFSPRNKYNPPYNLQTMNPCRETVKLRTMKNKNYENNNENPNIFAADVHGSIFEIHVKGQLDESWSDWLEGLEVKLLDNGEMQLSGHIRDQAALMGLLNRLYSLNLILVSFNAINQKR